MTRIISLTALAGLAPFVAALLVTFQPGLSPLDPVVFERAVIGYGALILSFLGGVRWGIRMQGGAGSDLIFFIGIVGSVAGFFTLLMPYTFGLVTLAIGFALQGAWDVWSGGVPTFYARIRGILTWLVCFVLLAILIVQAVL